MIKNFYPTPRNLIAKMLSKVQGEPVKILEPSAGKGDIIEAIQDKYPHRPDISAIEIDPDLQATLRGKNINVIDSDFLTYSGYDKFDLIIANPPFDDGDKHLLKAIDILYRGEIVFLLNAETIKNPCTNIRKSLAVKLTELNADIEYIQGAFKNAERQTGVEIALVYIKVEKTVEDDLFKGCDDKTEEANPEIEKNYEVSTGKTVEELVAEYNQIVNIGIQTIIDYYQNYKKIGQYIALNKEKSGYEYKDVDMTTQMQGQVNIFLKKVRVDFWRKTLDLPQIKKRLTHKKQGEFEIRLTQYSNMDFTESNIRQFAINLIVEFNQILMDAVLDVFDKFTIKHYFSDGALHEKNIHYFNGWKTNNAFKVGKKVIIPIYGGYSNGAFTSWSGEWKLDYSCEEGLRDIDIVMNYFDGGSNHISISAAIRDAFECGQSSKILSTYFEITCYKKGTIHLTFRDENILRRFNRAACLGKKWLPQDYGNKAYDDMDNEERKVVKSFEGIESYNKNKGLPLFSQVNKLQLPLFKEGGKS